MIPGILASQAMAIEDEGGEEPPVDDTVLFLCSFEGGNGDTTATDDSTYARPITFLSQAQIATAQAKFGSSSLEISTGGGR